MCFWYYCEYHYNSYLLLLFFLLPLLLNILCQFIKMYVTCVVSLFVASSFILPRLRCLLHDVVSFFLFIESL